MRKPEAAVAATLGRWATEEITLSELLRQLQGAGWTRREVYAYLEREADAMAARQSLGNRPQSGRLRNY
jgi:hypothetical protein